MVHATTGFEIVRHVVAHAPTLLQRASVTAQDLGSAQRNGTIGRPSTSNGAAISISSSCCVMCAENKTLPHACTGETSASTSAAQPSAKKRTPDLRTDFGHAEG